MEGLAAEHGVGLTHAHPPDATWNSQLCPEGHSPSHAGAVLPHVAGPATHTHAPESLVRHCWPTGQAPLHAGADAEQGPP